MPVQLHFTCFFSISDDLLQFITGTSIGSKCTNQKWNTANKHTNFSIFCQIWQYLPTSSNFLKSFICYVIIRKSVEYVLHSVTKISKDRR